MPNMTGIQLVERVLAIRPDTPIILATGYGELPGDAAARVRKLGKPFGQAELARAVAEAQQGSATAAEAFPQTVTA